ncbi:hypothetical protein [Cylindrospermopsis raciborskii]|uniref:hypothetical protein n=1 Tax=Cylindrospermopsis raciborskii TaxID=77022 RepID=UPI0015C47F9A|nr:hypothetical protein [Cylindrospermopsis raciborskii]
MTIVSQQSDRYLPYLLLQHRRILRVEPRYEHDVPMKRSLFTLSPNYSTAGFLEIEY